MAAAAAADEILELQLRAFKWKRLADVHELYLANEQLTEAPDVSRFSLLKYLWLNNNKIKKVTFSPANYILCELYLHNNKLTDITGSLKNVKSLRILTLHNNWLTDVLKTVKEFRNLKFLHTLNLFHNPLALEPDYRLYLIYYVPSLQNLDQRGIDQQEREASVALCNPDRVRVITISGWLRSNFLRTKSFPQK
ncbi:leucine-rich repeat-containing protein 72 [Callorhinchus milii]|uniref:leucine-rich repeat-containing protein 72 n=1 Tax=Callorhinchus milii TaxID=7868 RepID=UPI001C3F6164|nr:leucine-rich repeat-containing protein 72 [Callorhinchus milii]